MPPRSVRPDHAARAGRSIQRYSGPHTPTEARGRPRAKISRPGGKRGVEPASCPSPPHQSISATPTAALNATPVWPPTGRWLAHPRARRHTCSHLRGLGWVGNFLAPHPTGRAACTPTIAAPQAQLEKLSRSVGASPTPSRADWPVSALGISYNLTRLVNYNLVNSSS